MALREINLIAPDILVRRRLWRHLLFWAGCMAACLVLISGVYCYQRYSFAGDMRSGAQLKEIKKAIAARSQEITHLKEELNTLRLQQSVLHTITDRASFSMVLRELSGMINPDTWLSQLVIQNNAAPTQEKEGDSPARTEVHTTIELTGFSYSNERLADFFNRLSTHPLFAEVALKTAAGKGGGDVAGGIHFQLSCALKKESPS